EAIQALKGKAPTDLMEVTLALGAQMLVLGKKAKNTKEAEKRLKKAIQTGQALVKFNEMIIKQGGNPKVLVDFRLLPWAKHKLTVNSPESGYVKSIDTMKIGLSAVRLGAGREKMDSRIDPGVGFLIQKKVGDRVDKDEPLALVFTNDHYKGKSASREIQRAYEIGKKKTTHLNKLLFILEGKRTTRIFSKVQR
ncbi:MAG TPA: pyrimidine-nucleoside phosphorylase, partial [candidate division Zixibacteria bacterium]